jgi:pimeloyl-ACP methyl ester carboxylesterase
VAVGHSTRSIRVLAQAAEERHPALAGLILIGPVPFEPGPTTEEKPFHRQRALRALRHGHEAPIPLALSFCRRYLSLPDAYLSYLRWDRRHILEALERLRGLPVHVLIGDADVRFDAEWTRQMGQRGAQLHMVEPKILSSPSVESL